MVCAVTLKERKNDETTKKCQYLVQIVTARFLMEARHPTEGVHLSTYHRRSPTKRCRTPPRRSSRSPSTPAPFLLVDTGEKLNDLLDVLVSEPRIALDTEFQRERTYFPQLALVQVAWSGGVALIDPLAVDIAQITKIFGDGILIVLHAAQQDLDVLHHAVGKVPSRIFDTQIAASFLGFSTPSLASLVNAELKVDLAKGDRMTDWLRRPLTTGQLSYAASDVEHLLSLHDRLRDELEARGRQSWAEEACEELRMRRTGPVDPTDAWLKQKDLRGLTPRSRGIFASLAEWRERRAMAMDIPPRQVLPDFALHGVAQRDPSTVSELAHVRGVDDRHTRGAIGSEILEAVKRGRERRADLPTSEGEELDRGLRPASMLVSAWMSEVSRKHDVDATLLATRHDIIALLRRENGCRLSRGWRRDFVGAQIEDLLAGRLGLSLDGQGALRLTPVAPEVVNELFA